MAGVVFDEFDGDVVDCDAGMPVRFLTLSNSARWCRMRLLESEVDIIGIGPKLLVR
jgi:hypothetical protein